MSFETKRVSIIINRKWKKLAETENKQFYRYFRRLWEYIRSNPLSNEILEQMLFKRDSPLLIQLEGKFASEEDSKLIIRGDWTYYSDNTGGEERDIAAFIRIMDKFTGGFTDGESSHIKEEKSWEQVMYRLVDLYVSPENTDKYHKLNCFYSVFLLPILEYLQDNLDKNIFILDSLKKFKQKCEWFDREEMITSYRKATKIGEKTLKKFLYEYLFDQGIPFFIEPASPSGEIDFLLEQSGAERIGCEAKVYSTSKVKAIHGIEVQLPTYLREHSLSVGYIVIFKVGIKELNINLDLDEKVNYVTIGSKPIYIFVVDIYKNLSASKKLTPKRKPDTISKQDFTEHRTRQTKRRKKDKMNA